MPSSLCAKQSKKIATALTSASNYFANLPTSCAYPVLSNGNVSKNKKHTWSTIRWESKLCLWLCTRLLDPTRYRIFVRKQAGYLERKCNTPPSIGFGIERTNFERLKRPAVVKWKKKKNSFRSICCMLWNKRKTCLPICWVTLHRTRRTHSYSVLFKFICGAWICNHTQMHFASNLSTAL